MSATKITYFQISKLHLGQHQHQILTFTTIANIYILECILLMVLHPHNGNINPCQNAERISKREAKPLEPKSPTHLNYTSNIPRLVFFLYMKYFSGVCLISPENSDRMDSKQQVGFLLS
jgi:hypothetical protein